jgi:hypothetical protein
MTTESPYTFGDNDVASDRLRLLAQAFAPTTRDLLARLEKQLRGPPDTVVDLGCGPGFTTDLLDQALGPRRIFAVDRSARLLSAARARSRAPATWVEHDVSVVPLPAPLADVLYARFLLTHLRDVTGILAGWKQALSPRGVVVLEETASMASDHPAFRRYYALVERMQAHYGQAMYVGRSLDAAGRGAGLACVESVVAERTLPAATMAWLHALNLQTWRDDPFARASFDASELSALSETLAAIASSAEDAPPVVCGVKQLVLRRPDAGSSAA